MPTPTHNRLLSALALLVPALLVSLLPERYKKARPRLDLLASRDIHLLSGLLQALGFLLLLALGMLDYVQADSLKSAELYLDRSPLFRARDLMALGFMSYVKYLSQPLSLLYLGGALEGLVRLLQAALSERRPGTATLALAYRFMRELSGVSSALRLSWRLGPARRDEVRYLGGSRGLEIFSSRKKPWPPHQVLNCGGKFYVLVSEEWVARGEYHAYCYRLREKHPAEIIRGRILEYRP